MKLDFSAANEYRRCPERFRRRYLQEIDLPVASPPLVFGAAVHEGLGKIHDPRLLPRIESTEDCTIVDTLLYRAPVGPETRGSLEKMSHHFKVCRDCAALSAFYLSCTAHEESPIPRIDPHEKRSLNHGFKILREYIRLEPLKDFETVTGEDGTPFIEIDAALELAENLIFTGRIDAIMRRTRDGVLWVIDHKTKFTLGQPFIASVRPNHQLTGYLWGARSLLSEDIQGIIVNGILVAKVKMEFHPVDTRRREDEIEKWARDFLYTANSIVRDLEERGPDQPWLMNAPDACYSFWTECPFKPLCVSAPEMIEEMKEGMYTKRPWASFGMEEKHED